MQKTDGRPAHVPARLANQALIVVGIARLSVGLSAMDSARQVAFGAIEIARLELGAPDHEVEMSALEGALGQVARELYRSIPIPLLHQRVEAQKLGVGHFVVTLGKIQGVVHHAQSGLVIPHGVDQHLGRVEHRFDVGLVDGDRLLEVLQGVLGPSLGLVDVPDQVVRLRAVRIELEALLSG
ncbi:MAG: hypothetical protein QM778_02785 [Myxococcales bacterium]